MTVRAWVMAGVAVIGLAVVGIAGGMASTYSLVTGRVAVTNAQANSSWAVVAVFVKFDVGTNGTAVVRRVSQGNTYALGTCSFVNTTNLVWVPDRDYSFGFGDVLAVESTATNGVLQVLRKAD